MSYVWGTLTLTLTIVRYSGGSRKKIFGEGPGSSSFGRQQPLSEITIELIKNLGAGQDLGDLCPLALA